MWILESLPTQIRRKVKKQSQRGVSSYKCPNSLDDPCLFTHTDFSSFPSFPTQPRNVSSPHVSVCDYRPLQTLFTPSGSFFCAPHNLGRYFWHMIPKSLCLLHHSLFKVCCFCSLSLLLAPGEGLSLSCFTVFPRLSSVPGTHSLHLTKEEDFLPRSKIKCLKLSQNSTFLCYLSFKSSDKH